MAQGQRKVIGYDPNTGLAVYEDEPAQRPERSSPPARRGYNPLADQIGGTIGMAKRAGATVYDIGNLARAIFSLGMAPRVPTPEILQPTTDAQRMGGRGFDVAISTVPLAKGSQLVSKGVAMLPSAARLPAKMAGEALLSGTVAAAQGGDPLTAGGIAAAIPLAGKVASTIAPALREQATKKVTQALGATKEKFKAIATKRAPEILQRGLKGSRQSLLADATEHAHEAGRAVDDALRGYGGQRVPLQPVIDALEEAKSAFRLPRQMSVAEATRSGAAQTAGARVIGDIVEVPVILDKRPIQHLSSLQDTLKKLGDDATVDQVVAVRRAWDLVVEQAGGFAQRAPGAVGIPLREQSEAWAKKQATKAIRALLAEEVPDLARVNQEFAFWADLRKVLEATQGRTQAQGPGLKQVATGVGGLVTGAATGGGVTGAVGSSVIASKLFEVMTSPRWRLIDANLRNQLADALAGGDRRQIAALTARILAVSAGQATRPESRDQTRERR